MDGTTKGGITHDNLPDWYESIVRDLDFPLGWKPGTVSPGEWKARGRRAFEELLFTEETETDPAPGMLSVERRDGYEVRLLTFSPGRHRRPEAYLAVPDGSGPFPAALLLHDHGGFFEIGKEKMILPLSGNGTAGTARAWMENNYGGRSVGDELARRGWVVFATDALGWGNRVCGGYETQQALACNLLNLGYSWAGLIACEDRACAGFLSSLPFVDGSRIVSIGHSMGGFRSWQVAALSEDVTACVSICSFGTIGGLMAPGGNRLRGQSAFSMTHPGLTRLMDFPDIAALAAPKPMYLLNGLDDKLCPAGCVREAYGKTAAVYAAFGCSGNFRAVLREGGHVFSSDDQDSVYAWMGALPGHGESEGAR